MQKHMLWIHGFAGRPNNDIVISMRKHNPHYNIFSIEVDHHAIASMEKINNHIHNNKVEIVAGTSLGGYYAMCADFNGPKIVVNPVTNPVRDLRQFIGHNTYKPGRSDGQLEFEFTEQMLMEFGQIETKQLDSVICHYTTHDKILGESIKDEYNDLFRNLQMMDENILPGHFMTHKYIKEGLTPLLDSLPGTGL